MEKLDFREFGKPEILISIQALDRAKNDKYIKQSKNKKWYNRTIPTIANSFLTYHSEKIGDFKVSPRGDERRVAWSLEIDRKRNVVIIKIADLLYHITDVDYVDYWNTKARNRDITIANYGPYVPFVGL